jgi:hypothetical protein
LCWLHFVGQNHFYVMSLLSKGCCFIQSLLFSYVLREDSVKFSRIFFGSLSAVRTTWYPVWTPICPLLHSSGRRVIPSGRQTDQHHPSGRRIFPVRTLHCIEKLLFQLASVLTSQHPVQTSISDRSASNSFQVQIWED